MSHPHTQPVIHDQPKRQPSPKLINTNRHPKLHRIKSIFKISYLHRIVNSIEMMFLRMKYLPCGRLVLHTRSLLFRCIHHVGVHLSLTFASTRAEGLVVHALIRIAYRLVDLFFAIDSAVVASTHRLHFTCSNWSHLHLRHFLLFSNNEYKLYF